MNSSKNIDIFNILVFSLIIVFISHFFLISFFSGSDVYDNAIWHYLGWHWFNFKDIQEINIIDNKPPGIHYLYYLSSKYFDVNFLPLKLVAIFIKVVTGFLIFKISVLLTKKKNISYIVLLLYYLLLGWEQLDNYQPVYTENFTSFFSTLSVYVYIKYKNLKSLILSGIFFALGLVFKQTILIFFLGFLIMVYFSENKKKFNSIFIILTSFFLSFLLLISFLIFEGLNFSGLINQFSFFFNLGSDTIIQISSRIKHFLYRWTGIERNLLIILFCFFYYFVLIKKEQLPKLLFAILLLTLAGAHATGTIPGHQLIDIIPIFLILFSLILNDLLKIDFFYKKKYVILFLLFLFFSPEFDLGRYKVYAQNYSIRDKQNLNLTEVIDFVNQEIDNKNEGIYIHERKAELLLNLKKRSISNFHVTTFLYQSYNKGVPVMRNINSVKKQLIENQPKIIILLSSYENESPFKDKIIYFDEILKSYNLEKTIKEYDIYVKK